MLKISLFCLIYISGFLHDFHTSIAEVQYNSKTESLEVSLRVFTDDLEKVLSAANNNKLIKIEGDNNAIDGLIVQYLKKNFALVSTKKEVKLAQYYGRENEADATWLYFEIQNCKNLEGYTIFNAVFQETFEDQTNIINFTILNIKKSLVFDSKTKTSLWPF